MTSKRLSTQDIWYQGVHVKTGHVWMSPSGKTKFRRPADLKSAWKQAVMKAKRGEINRIGNANDVPPLRILKPILGRSDKPIRYVMPNFDQQNIYKIIEVKSDTLLQLERSKELLRLCAPHVTLDVKEQILKFLQEGK